jgi:hydrogenase maturation protein HypF
VTAAIVTACDIRVSGVVQGVGFRPFVFRLAKLNSLAGWVLNDADGVTIHLEGADRALEEFVASLGRNHPVAASITAIEVRPSSAAGCEDFAIRESLPGKHPSAGISADLPVCSDCLDELFDPANPCYLYPYINCTNCGPRYSVVLRLPYDRENTTMRAWPMDRYCAEQYGNPSDRRFHAQPVACPVCGPRYWLGDLSGTEAIESAVQLLKTGSIIAMKGLGGYHLVCDASNQSAVTALRERKFRKEKPFAVMVRGIETARALLELSPESEALLTSTARPIVLAKARVAFRGVAPENDDLGVMLPYTPLHHLLFDAGAPEVLVMTSANRSSEPIAYRDEDALKELGGIADAFLIGERPVARRVEDSIARVGAFGPVILRRARGYAPGAVASIPSASPILAVGADLKNTITLVVRGQAFGSPHIGDLDQYEALRSFDETIADFLAMYDVRRRDLVVVHDAHPQYRSSAHALALGGARLRAVQHHRAHIASVLAERGAWEKRVLGISFDGTGYGDDGTIWGGEFFAGSVAEGFTRVAHLRHAALAGGDSAARHPLQAAAGFLAQVDGLPDLTAAPFRFSERYRLAEKLVRKQVRSFVTTSVGRLFDTAAALLGFTREVTFEGQAAMWVEHLARRTDSAEPYPFPMAAEELDFRPLLGRLAEERQSGRDAAQCARAFQLGVARGLCDAAMSLCESFGLDTVVLSGGVFQNDLLLDDIQTFLAGQRLTVWTNHSVPPNDGGISLGQAALGAFAHA